MECFVLEQLCYVCLLLRGGTTYPSICAQGEDLEGRGRVQHAGPRVREQVLRNVWEGAQRGAGRSRGGTGSGAKGTKGRGQRDRTGPVRQRARTDGEGADRGGPGGSKGNRGAEGLQGPQDTASGR